MLWTRAWGRGTGAGFGKARPRGLRPFLGPPRERFAGQLGRGPWGTHSGPQTPEGSESKVPEETTLSGDGPSQESQNPKRGLREPAVATGGPPGPQRKASLPPPLPSWGLGRSCIHCRPGWQGTVSVHSPAPRPHLQAGRPMKGGGAGGLALGSEPLPWLKVPPRVPSGTALPRGPGSPLLPGRGRAKARSSHGVVTSTPFRVPWGGGGCWLGPPGFYRDPAFCPALKTGASGQGKCPAGKMERRPGWEEAASIDGGEGGLGFGGSVCSISYVQTKAKVHGRGPGNWEKGGGRSIPFLTTPFPRVQASVLQGQI